MSEELLRTRISSILTKIRNCDLPQRNFNKFVRIIKGFQKLFISCELIYWYRAAAETDRAETSVWVMESSGCETTPSCVNEWSDTLKEETGLQIAEIQYKIHSDYLIFTCRKEVLINELITCNIHQKIENSLYGTGIMQTTFKHNLASIWSKFKSLTVVLKTVS